MSIAAEAVEMGKSADIGFLHDVLSFAIVAHIAASEAVETLIVGLHNGPECTAFSGQRTMYQFDIIRGGSDFRQIISSVGQ